MKSEPDAEICLGVVEADALPRLAEAIHVGGIFAVFHPAADPVAQNASEIFETGIADEGTAVNQHIGEVAKQSEVSGKIFSGLGGLFGRK